MAYPTNSSLIPNGVYLQLLKRNANNPPKNAPIIWNIMYAIPKVLENLPVSLLNIKAKVTHGLQWEPETLALKISNTKNPSKNPPKSYKYHYQYLVNLESINYDIID